MTAQERTQKQRYVSLGVGLFGLVLILVGTLLTIWRCVGAP